MAYGPNFPALFRRAAEYVDKILRGAKPGELPVEQPTQFDFVINLKTANALGLGISSTDTSRLPSAWFVTWRERASKDG
jgi:putative ABC transport system substrate-binding protein